MRWNRKMNADEKNNPNLVDEFPRPPRYFECFQASEEDLVALGFNKPPPVPSRIKDGEDLYNMLYDGCFAKSKLPSMGSVPVTENENQDYRTEIKRFYFFFFFCQLTNKFLVH
jgi:hypothetical protein